MKQKEYTPKAKTVNKEILKLIENDPGLSKYELSKKLCWSTGKTDGAISRLLKTRKIYLKEIERDGRIVHLVYPSDLPPSEIIKIPESELKIGNPLWIDKSYFYALDSETLGITGKEFPIWDEIAHFKESNNIKFENGEAIIELPETFKEHYKLNEKHYSVSLNANNILVTITGKIIN
jgi:hypothetical protein